MKPRLLFISPRFLFPLDQGGRIRTANTLRHMKGGAFDITLMSPVPPGAERFAEQTAALCDRFVSWPQTPMSRLRRAVALTGTLPVAVATDASSRRAATGGGGSWRSGLMSSWWIFHMPRCCCRISSQCRR